MTETIGYIGLGQMGGAMTHNLLRAGYPCVVHDTDDGRVQALVAEGATAAANAAEVARQVDVLFTCLPNGDVVREVCGAPDGILAGCRAGQVYVDMSTNFPPWSIELAGRFADKGVDMLDAPISGGDVAAREGKLSIMVGGKTAAFERCRPLFDVLGQRTTHMGEAVGAGGYTKLSNQIMYAINLIGVVESLTFARKAGLDVAKVVEALSAGIANSRVLEVKAPKVLARDFSTQGPVWMLRKDLTYITRAMEAMEARLPVSPSLLPYYDELYDAGETDIDQVAVIKLFERMAGLAE